MPYIEINRPPENNRVLVCGGRDFSDSRWFWRILDGLHRVKSIEAVIHGGAKGADYLAGCWGRDRNVPVEVYPADWKTHGRAAGPIRNQKMLDEAKPGLVVAFAGGRGTADMLKRAKAAGVDWMHCSRDSDGRAETTGSVAKP